MRMSLVTLMLLGAATFGEVRAGSSQVVAPAPPPRESVVPPVPTGTGRLAGVVRDDAGRPLRRTNVAINGALQRSTITDDEGRFSFVNLPSGRFTITASKPAYPTMSYGAKRPYRPGAGVMLTAGQEIADLVIALARGAVITGTVFDEQGQPMPGVPMMAWEVRTALSGERTLDSPSSSGGVATYSDDQGQYRFFGLPPGEYTVGTAWFYGGGAGNVRVPTDAEIRAAFEGGRGAAGRSGTSRPTVESYNYTKVFHPSTIDPMAASTVVLKPGDERNGIDVHMQFRPMSRLDITLTGPADLPPARISVARASSVQALNTTQVSSIPVNGRYETHSLSPDRYMVRIQSQAVGGRPAMWAAGEATLVDADPVTLALALQPAMTATGRVVFESTTGASTPPLSNVNVGFAGVSPGTWGSVPGVTTDAAGNFTRDGLFPAGFRITASVPSTGPAAWTVKSVTMGGRDITDLPLEIRAGESPRLVITFTDQATELSGRLLDPSGQPSTDYFVVLLPADRAYWTVLSRRIASTRPDVQGRYVFRSLPPGEYRLAATTDLVNQDLQQVAQLEALAAQSLPITIGPGENKSMDIRVAGRQ